MTEQKENMNLEDEVILPVSGLPYASQDKESEDIELTEQEIHPFIETLMEQRNDLSNKLAGKETRIKTLIGFINQQNTQFISKLEDLKIMHEWFNQLKENPDSLNSILEQYKEKYVPKEEETNA